MLSTEPKGPDPAGDRSAATPLRGGPGVVEWRGRYALAITSTTPHEAMVEDLLLIRAVLDSAGIEYLLVRGGGRNPVLAVDVAARRRLTAALAEVGTRHPFYVKAVDEPKSRARPVADGRLSKQPEARVFRIFRPRVELRSGLRYGAGFGVQIELWSYDRDRIVAPIENSLTRRIIPAREMIRSSVERFGVRWPTIDGMFDPHAGDIDFDIDLVFSWVDGSDPEWRRRRARRMAEYRVGAGDDSAARYRQVDELRYALRSVYLYAPWIRRIFVATDSPKPAWLADHPRVTFVRSEEFFADPAVLPTYNSQAVESQLHRIEGLSEHFLYSNDDMFFGRPVTPDLFFSPGGISKFVEDDTRIGLGANHDDRSGFENSARVNRGLLRERYGMLITRHLAHSPAPLRRSVMAELEREFPAEFAATAASPFRARDNISVTNSLYHYYAQATGQAVTQTAARYRYVDTTTRVGLREMSALLTKRKTDFFCLNDNAESEVDPQTRAEAMNDFLRDYFPIPAPWEKRETARSAQSDAAATTLRSGRALSHSPTAD